MQKSTLASGKRGKTIEEEVTKAEEMDEEDSGDSQGEFVGVVTDRKSPFHQKSINTSFMVPQSLPYGLQSGEPFMGSSPPSLCHGEAQLALEEKKFLLAVERGDLATVRRTLEKTLKDPGHVNINCVDPLGRSALLMAIDNENLEMVELLIEHKVETKDALLHAIHEQYVEAVEVLLDHEAVIHRPNTPHSWEALDPDVATFTPDITPLILAAHKDNYEIIKILLDRGAKLPMPHDVRCGCQECVTSRLEDSLRHSRSRINAYRALASPSLIALSSKDPILTAFELSWELKRLSFLEHEFKNEYQELRKQCQNFATALLDHTRSSYELEVMLNHDPSGPAFEHGDRMQLNRLKLAIKYKQKKFVSHPNVQQLLASIWYEGLPGFRRKNVVFQTLQIVWIGFLFPIYSIVYILLPHTTLGQTMRKPFIKFIGHSASYITFLILLILAAQRIETVISNLLGHNTVGGWSNHAYITTLMNSSTKLAPTPKSYKDETTNKGAPPTIVECLILAWVMGLIWAEIKQLWEDGLIEYIGDMWNIIDFITNSLYVATIALRAVSYYQVQNEKALDPNSLPQERKDWEDWDPMLISEGLFSAANIFSSLKLVYIFSVNPHLGPLQISLGRMVIDILKFFFVYSLVLFAFACGMNQLLWYYADSEKRLCPTGEDVQKTESCYRWRRFSNLFESSQTLFWASFGLIDLNNFELAGIKSYTRFWGMLMFGTYSVINVVVLLNLLIAMMNHSYQLISDRTDVEWKFARSKLWISYFEEGGTVPPPFNIIPTPKILFYIFRWFYRKIYGRSRAAKKEHMRTIRRKARQASERDYRYQGIMRNLVRRYITVEQRKADNQGVTEDDVNEIKQDISAFRYELIEILKNSGMNTACVQEPQGPGGKKCRLKERRLMKGFNIGRAESFPLTETSSEPIPILATSASLPSPMKPSMGGIIKSPPTGKLKRAAKEAGSKHSYHRRWGNLVEAAKHSLGRSSSQDSFASQASTEPMSQQGGVSDNGESMLSYSGAAGAEAGNPISGGTPEGHSRMSALRSRLTSFPYFPAKFKVPSFDESKSNAKVRRHIYGGKIHTGSLKSFVKRTATPMFASQRVGSKPAPGVATAGVALGSGQSCSQHHLPAESTLTPIPSQPSSSTRSSPDRTPPSSPPHSGALPVGVRRASAARTPSPNLAVAPSATVSSPESGTMTASCSQEPLVSRRGSSPKPSNGSALIQKLPGVQPIGKATPSGWL